MPHPSMDTHRDPHDRVQHQLRLQRLQVIQILCRRALYIFIGGGGCKC